MLRGSNVNLVGVTLHCLASSPLFVLLGLGQDLHGLCLLLAPSVVGATTIATLTTHVAAEVAAAPVHRPEGLRRVHQLERALVLLMVVGVLGTAGSDGRVVFVDVAPVLVSGPCPVRYLQRTTQYLRSATTVTRNFSSQVKVDF